MNQKQTIKLVCLLWTTSFISCEKSLPGSPTIVKGNVVNEQSLPIAGVVVQFVGVRKKGLSAIPTFTIKDTTDLNGNIEFSKVIPGGADFAQIQPYTSNDFATYLLVNGKFLELGIVDMIPEQFGKTMIYNFQIKKR